MTRLSYIVSKIIVTALFLAVVVFCFENQHLIYAENATAIALRLICLLSSLAMIALLIAKKPFLGYVAIATGYLLGFVHTLVLSIPLLLLLVVVAGLHRLSLFTINRSLASS